MKSYLYVMVEDIPVLMDGDAVQEILPLAAENYQQSKEQSSPSAHLEWRNQVLPIISLRTLLDLPSAVSAEQGAGVVYSRSPNKPSVFLVVDEVVKILTLGLETFVPLPHVPEKIKRYFDSVYVDTETMRQVYRFRNNFPIDVF